MISHSLQTKLLQSTYALTDGRFIDLDGLDTSFLQINYFVTESEGELLGLELTRDIGTGEGPVEDGDWTGQHPLHWFLRDALSVATPLDGDWMGTADIGDDDGRSDVSRAVALDPTVLGEGKSIELFAKVLNHIVPLRFTVDEEIEADSLLEGNDGLNLLFDKLLVLFFGDLVLAQLSTSATDLLGLREGTDGGSGKLGQFQLLLLDLLTLGKGTLPIQHIWGDGSDPLADCVVGGMLELTSPGDRGPVLLQRSGDGRILGSGKNSGNDVNLGSLLKSEGEPILLVIGQLVLRSEGNGSVKEG